ncbi:hypothetical protein GA0115256_104710 [Streptomyces sp. DconLS]|nr:hypothetical protein GA0115256_104710 [Streptomyces sp. DconLS]SCF85139.1 hypothetical protein GA0115258_114222 [Streptomyces sp. LamerLS-31b]
MTEELVADGCITKASSGGQCAGKSPVDRPVHTALAEREIRPRISKRGTKTPIQTDGRWVVERTNSWMNNFGKLRRSTERRRACTEFFLALATAVITVRSLIRRAWYTHRWDTRPRSPRIR